METKKSNSSGSSKNSGNSKSSKDSGKSKKGEKSSMKSSQLMELFEHGLKDIYWAENALLKAIPKMAKETTSIELNEALTMHLSETEEQINRLDQVFELLEMKAKGEKCEAMAGLIKESEEIMKSCEKGSMRDAGIISAAQKVEHYEIATYGTLRQFAETLNLKEIEELLASTLEEEKTADLKLSQVAMEAVNVDASEEES